MIVGVGGVDKYHNELLHITAEYIESFKELCHWNTDRKRQHEDLGNIRKKKDEADVLRSWIQSQ